MAQKKSAKKSTPVARKKAPAKRAARHEHPMVSQYSPEELFKAKIKVIGIGGGGGAIVSDIGKTLEKATFVVADTDVRALKKRPGIKYVWFGEEFTRGLGTGLNVDLGKKSAESAKEKISSLVNGQDIVIFVASLGGGVGSGATQVFAKAAREFGGITLGIFTMPFKFEGQNKHNIARNALRELRDLLNVSLVIPNEKIFKVIDENTAITDAFALVNKSLINSLESLIDLIYSPGVINIDFADLRAILRGIGNTAFLNTVEESGKNRAEKICERILVNPLLQNGSLEAEKILLNIAGSDTLSMLEVDRISRHVAGLNPKAKIIFGISKNNKLGKRLKATILVTGGGRAEPVAKPASVPEKPEKAAPEVKKPENSPKKTAVKKPVQKAKKPNTIRISRKEEIPLIPVFSPPAPEIPVAAKTVASEDRPAKQAIRRNALEVKRDDELAEKRRQEQEKEWEIPAFLRKMRYKP